MSLINEALKRAKQAPPPRVPELSLRPVETPASERRGSPITAPLVLSLVGVVALLLVWEIFRQSGVVSPRHDLVVSAQTAAVAEQPAATPAAATSPITAPAPKPAPSPQPPPAAAVPGAGLTIGTGATNIAAPANETNAAPAAAPAPEPPPLKLQGIVYNPSRPSAMINGRTVFIGERVRDFRVVAITSTSVTLSANGQSKVLELAD